MPIQLSSILAAVIQRRSIARLGVALTSDVCVDFATAVLQEIEQRSIEACREVHHGYEPKPSIIGPHGFLETPIVTTVYMEDGSVNEIHHQEICGEIQEGV